MDQSVRPKVVQYFLIIALISFQVIENQIKYNNK